MLDKVNAVYAILGILVVVLPMFGWFIMGAYRGMQSYRVIRDIAEQFRPNGGNSLKDRLDQLHESVELLAIATKTSMNLVPYPLMTCTSNGAVNWINREFTSLTALGEDEAFGLGWLNMVDCDQREHVKTEWLSALADGRSVRVFFNMVDGSEVTLEALPLMSRRDKEIKVRGLMGTLRIERGFLHHG